MSQWGENGLIISMTNSNPLEKQGIHAEDCKPVNDTENRLIFPTVAHYAPKHSPNVPGESQNVCLVELFTYYIRRRTADRQVS